MRTLVTAVVVAALVGGCAMTPRKPVYEKAGVSAEQKKKDESACLQAGLDTPGGIRGGTYISVDRDAVDRCMRERGYTTQATK
jgi:hypothetical protein